MHLSTKTLKIHFGLTKLWKHVRLSAGDVLADVARQFLHPGIKQQVVSNHRFKLFDMTIPATRLATSCLAAIETSKACLDN